jgi:hypothetical protein
MAVVCLFEYQSAFFLISIQVHLYLVQVSFILVRMASVKQFLVDIMLFAVGGGEGILSRCEQQQQNEKHFKWGKGNSYISVLNKFSVTGCEKKHGVGNKK